MGMKLHIELAILNIADDKDIHRAEIYSFIKDKRTLYERFFTRVTGLLERSYVLPCVFYMIHKHSEYFYNECPLLDEELENLYYSAGFAPPQ